MYDILEANYKGESATKKAHVALHEAGFMLSMNQVKSAAWRRNLRTGIDTRFKQGHAPFNTGRKMAASTYKKTSATFFKKGSVPKNTLYDLAVTTRKGKKYKFHCYMIREKIGTWVTLQTWAYIEAVGEKIPKGHFVVRTDIHAFNALAAEHFPMKPPAKEPEGHWENLLAFAKKAAHLLLVVDRAGHGNRCGGGKLGQASVELTDNYVAEAIRKRTQLPREIIHRSPGMIETYREVLQIKRHLKDEKRKSKI